VRYHGRRDDESEGLALEVVGVECMVESHAAREQRKLRVAHHGERLRGEVRPHAPHSLPTRAGLGLKVEPP
jgi:chloramphenicol 3-O-phosphotransferase